MEILLLVWQILAWTILSWVVLYSAALLVGIACKERFPAVRWWVMTWIVTPQLKVKWWIKDNILFRAAGRRHREAMRRRVKPGAIRFR